MTINNYFDKFLENIEPNKKYKDYAIAAHTKVREYLESEDSQFSAFVNTSFLYGSYARFTAEGNIKDVDICLIVNFDHTKAENSPSKVLPKLKAALTRLYKDPGATDYQRKSIQVLEPLPEDKETELTLDIIPAILTGSDQEKLLVPDTENDTWVYTHPKAHLEYTSTMNDDKHGKGMFVPLVKIMKHWWKFQSEDEKAKPKGFWLEMLTGDVFDPSKKTYAEHFVTVLQGISKKFFNYENMTEVPAIDDVGLPGETLKTSMTLGEFVHFMDAVNDTLAIAQEALGSTNIDASIHLWNAVFGDEFPKSEKSTTFDLSKIVEFIGLFIAPNEQYLKRDFGISFEDHDYTVKIDATATQNGFRPTLISRVPLIKKKAELVFGITKCNVPEPYSVMWKVKNTGKEATRIGQQRGEITHDRGKRKKVESTLYTGTHFVECYIIDSRKVCVGWDRVKVRIP